jgi:N-terminal domain of anti-restriction factor ArdC
MSSNAITNEISNVTSLPSTPKAQTAKKVIAANVKLLIEQLEAGHSEGLTAYLTAMGRFHSYSLGNILEIARQRPSATRVAGMYAWNQLGRRINKGEKGRLHFNSKRPAKADAPFAVDVLMQDFFRRAELLVVRHVLNGCAKVLCRESRDTHRMKTLRLGLRAELQADRSILTYIRNRSPESEEFRRRNQDAGVLEKVLRERSPAQHCRDRNTQFL